MGVGDPWDTSYDPTNPKKRNRASGKLAWGPDVSDEYSYTEAHEHRGAGRFCKEGCGCVDLSCNSITGATCSLPPEIVITLVKGETGRVEARAGVSGGDVWHLKYTNGLYRGRKCCTSDDTKVTGDVDNFDEFGNQKEFDESTAPFSLRTPRNCDPCKVTTLPNGKESQCWRGQNKYLGEVSASEDGNGTSEWEGEYTGRPDYEKALSGEGTWPRSFEELSLTPDEWGQALNSDSKTDVDHVINEDGTITVTEEEDSLHKNDLYTGSSLIEDAHYVCYNEDGHVITASSGRCGRGTPVFDEPAHKRQITHISKCFHDGQIPAAKKPKCRNIQTGKDIEVSGYNYCTGSMQYTYAFAHCVKKDTQFEPTEAGVGTDKKSCESGGDRWITLNEIINHCQSKFDESGVSSVWLDSEAGCQLRGVCKAKNTGEIIEGIDNEKECREEEPKNHFLAHQWVDWERDPESCCGGMMTSESHPSHTPQVSGGFANTRKNNVCFTPYRELVLTPDGISGTDAPIHAEAGCVAIQNQEERITIHADTESYWTVTLRECGFWADCFNDQGERNTSVYGKNQMGCGEELMLYFPMDQFLNCSDFNLTLSDKNTLNSGWSEVQQRWNSNMSHYFGNPAGFFPGNPEDPEDGKHWCAWPNPQFLESSEDAICERYTYQESGKPIPRNHNPLGHLKLKAFNYRPQPFKATEKTQNYAKGVEQAVNDHRYWQKCAAQKAGGGGKWFINMGLDYWFTHDFLYKNATPAVCESVSQGVRDAIDGLEGSLTSHACGISLGWDAWQKSEANLEACDCGGEAGKSPIPSRCKTENEDSSTFSYKTLSDEFTEDDCKRGGGEVQICCEDERGCSRPITWTLDLVKEGSKCRVPPVFNETVNTGTCRCVVEVEGEGDVPEYRVEESQLPSQPESEDDEAENCKSKGLEEGKTCIWFGDEIIDDEGNALPPTDEDLCREVGESQDTGGEIFTASALTRPANDEGECTCTLSKECAQGEWTERRSFSQAVLTVDAHCEPVFPVPSNIVAAATDSRIVGERGITISGHTADQVGQNDGDRVHAIHNDSLDYWGKTGLFPKGEGLISFVNNHCIGTGREVSVQDASNTSPITVTSRNHRLVEGTKVMTYGIIGNFAANVLSNRDWQEMQYQDKIYTPCTGDSCDDIMFPGAKCPGVYKEDGTYECPDEFLACYGSVIMGRDPDPAPWFVAKNITRDTFDLFACDGKPIDGTINAFANLPELERLGCDDGVCIMGDIEQTILQEQKTELTLKYTDGTIVPFAEADEEKLNGELPKITSFPDICVSKRNFLEKKVRDKKLGEVRLTPEQLKEQEFCKTKRNEEDEDLEGPFKITNVIGIYDDPETPEKEGGGRQSCERYGFCKVMKKTGEKTTHEMSMTKEECFELAKHYRLYPNEGTASCERDDTRCVHPTKKSCIIDNTIQVEPYGDCGTCSEGDHKHKADCLEESGDPVWTPGKLVDFEIQQEFKTQSNCQVEKEGTWIEEKTLLPQIDKDSCTGTQRHNGKDRILAWSEGNYHTCVQNNGEGDGAFSGCWAQHRFGPAPPESNMEIDTDVDAHSFISYKTCPYTGAFAVMLDDEGVNAGYVSHYTKEEIDELYHPGWDGIGYKYEHRAQDWYMQVEQKGTCPVCCDHFLPHTLNATLTAQDSSWNRVGCGRDICRPEFVGHQGYCCSDTFHGCNISDIPHCETGFCDKPDNHSKVECEAAEGTWKGNWETYGKCIHGETGERLIRYRKDDCDKVVDSDGEIIGEFEPLKRPEDCDMFIRKRPNVMGTTNCRDCGCIYRDSQNAPIKNDPCCPNCECMTNDQDVRLFAMDYPYWTCREIEDYMINEGIECGLDEVGVEHNFGLTTATCKFYSGSDDNCAGVSCGNFFDEANCVDDDVNNCCQWHGFDAPEDDGKCCVTHDGVPDCAEICRNEDTQARIGNFVTDEATCSASGGVIASGETGSDYDTCEIDEDGDPTGNSWTTGECKKAPAGEEDGRYDWSYEPCICYPEKVSHDCHPGQLCTEGFEGSCLRDGISSSPKDNCLGVGGKCDCSSASDPTACGDAETSTEETCKEAGGKFYYPQGCGPRHISTDFQLDCYDLANSCKQLGADETVPGFGSMSMPLEFNGVTWASTWHKMNNVGMKSCHMITYPEHCSTGWACVNVAGSVARATLAIKGDCLKKLNPDWEKNPDKSIDPDEWDACLQDTCKANSWYGEGPGKIETARRTRPAINTKCNGCDQAIFGLSAGLHDVGPPTEEHDAFFTRLLLGCGSTIGSASAHDGDAMIQGGFDNTDSYRRSGMELWMEIMNCSYWNADDTVINEPMEITGMPPIYPGANSDGCWSGRKVNDERDKLTIGEGRFKYYKAGNICILGGGPEWPCTGCCTYTGPTQPTAVARSGASALYGMEVCATGGDVKQANDCQQVGMKLYPDKPAETFNVYYVKDVQEDGSGTLVVGAYGPTFGGRYCAYEAGATVGIGMADKAEAEGGAVYHEKQGRVRNRQSRNPFLPFGGTKLTEAIPDGNLNYSDMSRGRGDKPFMEIKVADVTKLISAAHKYDRHLGDYSRSLNSSGELSGIDGKKPKTLPSPYGLHPWPVDTVQDTRGSLRRGLPDSSIQQHPLRVESLALDELGHVMIPGRVGPIPTAEYLNKYSEYKEVKMGGGHDGATTSTPIPIHDSREPAGIKSYRNVYDIPDENDPDPSRGYCTNGSYTSKKVCEKNNSKWIYPFSHTVIETVLDHDLNDGEKVLVSGSIMYRATCKGVTLGECYDYNNPNITKNIQNPNDCMVGKCIDPLTGNEVYDANNDPIKYEDACSQAAQSNSADYQFVPNGIWRTVAEDSELDEYLCEDVFGGEWVIGRRNLDKTSRGEFEDPFNNEPKILPTGQYEEGCPIGCRINAFYTNQACQPPTKDNPDGKCLLCHEVEIIEKDASGGEVVREVTRCPYHDIDDMHIVRLRHCQNALFNTKEDCESNGWQWYPIPLESNEFAIHGELNYDVHETPYLKIAEEYTSGNFRSSNVYDHDSDVYPFSGCNETACGNSPDCYLYKDPSSDEFTCVNLKSATVTSGASISIKDMHDNGVPKFGDGKFVAPNLQKSLCEQSSNCQFVEVYGKCYTKDRSTVGTCVSSEGVRTTTKHGACSGAFIPEEVDADSADECLESNGTVQNQFICMVDDQGGTINTTHSQECRVLGGTPVWIGTPFGIRASSEKTNIETTPERIVSLRSPESISLGGTGAIGEARRMYKGVIAAGDPKAEGAGKVELCYDREGKMYDRPEESCGACSDANKVTKEECLAQKNDKGEPINQWEAYNFSRTSYTDPYAELYPSWSRHGGQFSVIVGYPPPLDDCAQGNSSTPVNMEYWFFFPQKCVNARGPMTGYECGDKCYDTYIGPMATSIKYDFGLDMDGNAPIKVNITE